MAAPMLSVSDIQGSVKNQIRAKQQKKKRKKMVLCSPYSNSSPTLTTETQEQILQKLVESIKPLGIAEEREQRRRQTKQQRVLKCKSNLKNKRNGVKDLPEAGLEGASEQGRDGENTLEKVIKSTGDVKDKESVQPQGPEPSTDVQTKEKTDRESRIKSDRSKLCFGIKEVIKGLERDQMQLVLACQSCKPDMLTQHLIGLAASRSCPASLISNLSSTLCPVLKISSLMAIGIKKNQPKESSSLDEAVEFISNLIPVQTLPWIESVSVKNVPITDLDTEHMKEKASTETVKEEAKSVAEKTTKDAEFLNTQKDVEKPDYSQFYVYKKDSPFAAKSFGADFIPFSVSSGEVNMDVVPDFGRKRKNNKEDGVQVKFRKYQETEYLPVFGNDKKVKKKRKRNKNKSNV
ncbi:ribonuclease P protein subunit p38-like [Saccostrea echinata]|uniref:ribonuclease P protein subunit p38-like n=1 Tax=Saccostrea echinata TaxID=191078 RepID=UPI002A81C108|nr:ribonuclease P protein subunit p38-like [Saccostrea echinata]